MQLKPGLHVKIVTDLDRVKERVYVRNSIVHDVTEGTVIIAQTEPLITKSMLNKQVTITYLENGSKPPARYGFPAEITDLIDDYRLSSSEHAKAVVVERRGDAAPHNVRMFFRVGPTEKSNLDIYFHDRKLNLIDISLRGVKFCSIRPFYVDPATVVEFRLEINGETYACQATILRTWDEQVNGFRQTFASAEFVEMDQSLELVLSRKVRAIEREHNPKENGKR